GKFSRRRRLRAARARLPFPAKAGIAAAHGLRPLGGQAARERTRAAAPRQAHGLLRPARPHLGRAARRLSTRHHRSARGISASALVKEQDFTILLVEDDRAVQRALAEALHQSGFTVLAEHDGEWALSTFQQRRVDLVVLDAVLPRRNGFQLALEIRRSDKGRRVPILLVSGVYET